MHIIEKLTEITERPDLMKRIKLDTNLANIGLLSIGLVKLVVHLEQTLGIAFEDEEMLEENFLTITQITDNAMRKMEAQEGRS